MILYHYCSTYEFYSIITNRTIWLSSLSLSSDSMEGKLVADLILDMAKSDRFDEATIRRLQDSVSLIEKAIEGLGFCLSEEGDLLSQWRGYAEDASGVSIGFSNDYLIELSKASRNSEVPGFTLQKVEYDRNAQKKLIMPTYDKIKELINQGALKKMSQTLSFLDFRSPQEIDVESKTTEKALFNLNMTIFTLFTSLFLLKTKAFQEEREWRLISYLAKVSDDQCLFRYFLNKIIPHRIYPLVILDKEPIVKVVLGPKNKNPESFIDLFLKQNKFKNVSVVRSDASYR